MATENTTATEAHAPAVTTATEAPATGEATQTQAPAATTTTATPAPVDLKGLSKDAHKAAVAASIAARRASATTSTEKPATAKPGPSGEAPAAAKEPPKEAEKVEPEKPATPPKPTEEEMELEAAKRLNEIAQSGKRMREKLAREQAEASAKAAAREKELTEREARIKAEEARSMALAKAKAGGKKLDVLRAAGYTEEEIRGQFFLDAMKELNDEPEAPSAAALPKDILTKEEALALIKQEREAAAAAERQRIAEQQAAQLKQQQDAYFGSVVQEFAKGTYPLVRAIQPSMGEMHQYLMSHYQKTGESLKPDQLLQHFEERYKKAGITVATKEKPAPKPPAATTRTITPAATSDAGDQLPPPEKKPRTWNEIRSEGFQKWKASRAGTARQ